MAGGAPPLLQDTSNPGPRPAPPHRDPTLTDPTTPGPWQASAGDLGRQLSGATSTTAHGGAEGDAGAQRLPKAPGWAALTTRKKMRPPRRPRQPLAGGRALLLLCAAAGTVALDNGQARTPPSVHPPPAHPTIVPRA